MTVEELVAIMGEPTLALPDNVQWAAFEWTFNAKIATDGTAYNSAATDATKADVTHVGLACPWIRLRRD